MGLRLLIKGFNFSLQYHFEGTTLLSKVLEFQSVTD